MDGAFDLRTFTEKHFDSINFNELSDSWIEEVINCEFTDVSENDLSLDLLFTNDILVTLSKLTDVCNVWCENEIQNVDEISVNTSTKETFWGVLDEMEISVKQIQALIYLLCQRSVDVHSSRENMEIGLSTANWYYNCLKIPGSAAYSIYHPNLFHVCVDCFPVPDFTADKGTINAKDFEKLLPYYTSALTSLIPILSGFHLGNNSSTVEQVIKKMVELTACEIQTQLNFNIDILKLGNHEARKHYKPSYIVSCLAFHTLNALIESDLNGDKDDNYSYILAYLNRHILCLKAKKSQSITQKYNVIKNNAVEFIIHNLKTIDFSSEVTAVALKRLCLAVLDKVDFRTAVSQAVTSIMRHMKIDHLAEMIQWILMLVDSVDVKDRMIALDILDQILTNGFQVSPFGLSDDKMAYLTEMPLIFAVLTRCDDTSPNVRTKALTVLSQNMRCVLHFLENTKDQQEFDVEDSNEASDKDLTVNGNHRYFWYNLSSLRDRLNEIASILHRRIDDHNGVARKATLQALENLIVFDLTYLTVDNLKFFEFASKDCNILVKKQVIQSLTVVLQTYYNNSLSQEWWIKCIFPLVQDPENSVQTKVLSVMEEQFLTKLLSSDQRERDCSFCLLKLLSSGAYSSYQVYLHKVFRIWKSENKLRSKTIVQLDKFVNTDTEECFWFFLSNFAKYSTVPKHIIDIVVQKYEEFNTYGVYPSYVGYIMSVLLNVFSSAPDEKLVFIQSTLSSKIKAYEVPIECIPVFIELLNKIHKHCTTEEEFSNFSSEIIEKCLSDVSRISSKRSIDVSEEDTLIKCFCIIKEICQLSAVHITKDMITLLKSFCDLDKSHTLSPKIRAHAFAALGKICLQEELFAKELLSVLAHELLKSEHDVIRNNVVIILIDMCKRYTSLADKYVPLLCLCFKDNRYVIRYQAIALIINLIQEDFVKWKGTLLFCLVYATIDKRESIQELAKFCLRDLMKEKKSSAFADNFVDSIFVYNNFPPPDNEPLSRTVEKLKIFSIKGNEGREKRMILYKFMLECTDSKERACLIRSVLNVLSNVADGLYPINEVTEIIIKDCFAILACQEIRAFSSEMSGAEIEDDQVEIIKNTEYEMRRLVLTEFVIPTIINLKNATRAHFSHLSEDIIAFLKEVLQDYKDDAKHMLEGDKQLQKEVMAEMSRDVLRSQREAKEKNKTSDKSPSKSNTNVGVNNLALSSHKNISNYLLKEVNGINDGAGPSSASPEELQPQQPVFIPPNSLDGIPVDARLASTPKVSLERLRIRPSNVFNISAIEREREPMNVDDYVDEIS